MSKATGITATLIEGEDRHERAMALPGAFYYVEWGGIPDGGMMVSCPCGCGGLGSVNLKPQKGYSHFWANTGTRERPNLNPSIGINGGPKADEIEKDGYHWHGHLRDGVFVSVN